MTLRLTRRKILTGLGIAAPVAAVTWASGGSLSGLKRTYLQSGEWLAHKAHRTIGRAALAREYGPEHISPTPRINGTVAPDTTEYVAHQVTGFADWRLKVDGMVAQPLALSLADLRAMPARRQITRLDCVEGWSMICDWQGARLSAVLDRARLHSDARYIVFWCADEIRGWQYYESIDLIDAYHEQTILAYDMNGLPLPTAHGAPVRLRVERQLGYKNAKFIMRIEAVKTLDDIGMGGGGFWQDAAGYEWYAGI